jgi:hypothetical protein
MGLSAPIIDASLWLSMIAVAPTVRAGYAPTIAGIAFDLVLSAVCLLTTLVLILSSLRACLFIWFIFASRNFFSETMQAVVVEWNVDAFII